MNNVLDLHIQKAQTHDPSGEYEQFISLLHSDSNIETNFAFVSITCGLAGLEVLVLMDMKATRVQQSQGL